MVAGAVIEGALRYAAPANVAWSALGAVAWHVPYTRSIYGLCDEVVALFGASLHISDNCREVVRWASNMKTTLETLQGYFDKHPGAETAVDVDMLACCERHMQELVKLSKSHQKFSRLVQFALSRKMQTLIDAASEQLSQAVQKLQLGLSVKAIGVNLRIDENVSLLLSAMDDVQVRLSTFASAFNRLEVRLSVQDEASEAGSSATTAGATAVTAAGASTTRSEATAASDPDAALPRAAGCAAQAAARSGLPPRPPTAEADPDVDSISATLDSVSTDTGGSVSSSMFSVGDGPKPDMASCEDIIGGMQVHPPSFKRVSEVPVGRGGSALVFKVEHMGQVRAAKVLRLSDLLPEQLQKVYIKFTRELYILATLRHPHVVDVVGCAASATELTILMEFMMRGSLRKVLNEPHTWSKFTPHMRGQVLVDIIEGMRYLHSSNVYHRDLKSHNVLITEWGRAKLTDFGLSRITSAVSSFTGRSTLVGGTVAWMAPESFGKRQGSASMSAMSDLYSYGIVTWEVLAGIRGHAESTPWYGKSVVEVISAVTIHGERLPLHEGCVSNSNISKAAMHVDVMRRCWSAQPSERPTFEELSTLFASAQ